MEIVNRKIDELIPAEYNPRQLTTDQFDQIKASLQRFGCVDPVIVNTHPDRKDIIVGGHQRLKVWREMGNKDIPTVEVNLDRDKERELNVRLNKNTGGWDWDELANQFDAAELVEWGFTDEDLTGFAGDDPGPEEDDEVPEPPKEARTERGRIYQLGKHRLLCGDSTDEKDVAVLMDGEKADFCFTSPPYSDMRDYGGGDMSVSLLANFIPVFSKVCDFFAVNLGIQRKDGAIFPYWNDYIQSAEECGLSLTAWNIWNREGMGGSISNMSAMFPIEHEWIFIFGGDKERVNRTKKNKTAGKHTGISNRQKDGTTKKAKPKIVKEYGRIGSVYTGCYEAGNSPHPAAYPIHFPKEYINACSPDGGIIAEPFGGSGTTLIACEQTGRSCRMMELDPIYCDVIVQRYANYVDADADEIFKTGVHNA